MEKELLLKTKLCDICYRNEEIYVEADAQYDDISTVSKYSNGEITFEWSSTDHIDLCRKHAQMLKNVDISESLKFDRYDNPSDKEVEKYINECCEKIKEVDEIYIGRNKYVLANKDRSDGLYTTGRW